MAKAEYRSAVRSRKLIKASLGDLLQEKPLDKITVTDVVARAGINRGTFYAHYRDIPDVIDHLIQETFTRLRKALSDAPKDMSALPRILTRQLRDIMEEDMVFYRKILNSGASQLMQRQLTDIMLEYMLSREAEFSSMDHEQYVVLIRFCAGGLGALYHDWFSGKIEISLEEMNERAEKMMRGLLV